MKWLKKGLIFAPDGRLPWARHSALQPTPLVIEDKCIRIYVGLRDEKGVSRVGFVDVDPDNPKRVLDVAEDPVLDIGIDGAFDENGVVPCAVARRNGKIFMYYAGYQLGQKVRFFVLGGLATSDDGGQSFTRYQRTPILERSDQDMFFRVVHSVMLMDGFWRIWYGGGSEWVQGKSKTLPVYDVKYLDSPDGIHLGGEGRVCIPVKGGDEHRVGRPYVIRDQGIFKMFYSIGTRTSGYRLGYAESGDGTSWERKDELIGIDVSLSGWDSQMLAYPSVVRREDRVYLFYNGNNYGETGVGYAILEE
jgi:hypothetical protein